MTALDFDSDRFLQLLTDALRSGPGSPAWHEAVGLLKENGSIVGADEYRMLLQARENLESGKEYRSVRAGPELTRKIFAGLDAADAAPRSQRLPTATLVAVVAALVGILTVAWIARLLYTGGQSPRPTLADLQAVHFSQDVLATSFDSDIPPGWRKIGSLDGVIEDEFRPPASVPAGDYRGCGVATVAALPADGPCVIEVGLRLADATEAVVTQVFVTDQADFSADRGITSHEFVWELRPVQDAKKVSARQQIVLPDGTFANGGQSISKELAALTLRIALNSDYVLVDSNGQRLFAGRHQLSAQAPRFAGVRFLRRGDAKMKEIPALVTLRLSKGI